ncbi:MAG: polyamine aminopropyltransferase [Deltaproteobacteria bacterium]|nr:polyamine aminopropyltransferase [Deltaproteobacteria bacterium]
MSLWYYEIFENKSRLGLKVNKTVFQAKSEFQTVEIFETDLFGKVLALDSTYQTSVGDEFYYHEMIVHPALTTAPQIRRVLVIGGGDGGSVREVLRHQEVNHVTMVEIDAVVVDACKKHLPEIGQAWSDPRLELLIQDGVAFIEKYNGGPFDVIIIDGPDPVGPAKGLFKYEFYRDCCEKLSPQGVLVVQSESPHVSSESFIDIVSELKKAFRAVHPYLGPVPIYPCGGWSYVYASNQLNPLKIIDQRAERIEKACRYYNRDIHRAAFALPNNLKRILNSK